MLNIITFLKKPAGNIKNLKQLQKEAHEQKTRT